jgi:hypothetical protein
LRVFFLQSRPDAMRCVPLFTRRLAIRFQDAVDYLSHGIDLRPLPFVLLPLRRDRAGDRLSHHPPVHAAFFG